jgi:hypothetical protein
VALCSDRFLGGWAVSPSPVLITRRDKQKALHYSWATWRISAGHGGEVPVGRIIIMPAFDNEAWILRTAIKLYQLETRKRYPDKWLVKPLGFATGHDPCSYIYYSLELVSLATGHKSPGTQLDTEKDILTGWLVRPPVFLSYLDSPNVSYVVNSVQGWINVKWRRRI